MKLFLDTNVLIAALTDETERADAATAVLNLAEVDGVRLFTSLVNLMELRAALAKRHYQDRDAVNETIGDIVEALSITIPDASDMTRAFNVQAETLMYAMDAIVLAQALSVDAEVVTFDKEVLENAGLAPESVIERLDEE